jgi:hypothetical protein
MGTFTPAQLVPFSPLPANNQPLTSSARGAATPASQAPAGAELATSRDTLGSDPQQRIANQFEATVYHSQVRQVSLAAQFQEVAARFADTGDGSPGATEFRAQQLTFDFFAESREETLVQFGQRTQSVAKGLEGTQQETFLQASRRVAARFQFSATISGSALNGFANAAEDVQGRDEILAKLLDLANQLLSAADEAFNEFFSLFDGSVTENSGEGQPDFVQKIMDQFMQAAGALFNPGANQSGSGSQAASFSFQMEMKFEFSFEVSVQGEVQQSDPIMFDLDSDGFELSSYTQGARFDILGNGKQANTAFVNGGDAFLALDRNRDGQITSGSELFGDQNGAVNGFEELRKLDSNGDGVINRTDRDCAQLLLWRDNGDGKSDPGELLSLAEAGIEEISLQYRDVNLAAAGGNRLAQLATFRWSDGRLGNTADAILNYTVT